MSFTSQSSPTQRVPAWKRLGLKLKPTPAATAPAAQPSANNKANQSGAGSKSANGGPSPFENRRKRLPSPPADGPLGNKRVRFDSQGPSYQNGRRSFNSDTRDISGQQAYARRAGGEIPPLRNAKDEAIPKKKPPSKKTKAPKPLPPPTLGEQHLEYLQRYKNDRAAWKFNTNSQTLLIKYVFVDGVVPASHIDTFYDYIRDVKGMTRNRLLETAQEVVKGDRKKTAGFGDKSEAEVDKAATEEMQAEYDDLVSHFPTGAVVNGNGKRPRRISEVEFVLRSANPDVQRRLRRRIRAENVIAELSDSEISASSSGATTTTSASTPTGAGSSSTRGVATDGADVKMEISEEPRKKTRKKKMRNNMVDDDTSSSEDESDEEESSDTSSSSSSEDESEDEEMPLAGAVGDAETSSSSSSSSEEDSEEVEGDEDDDDDDDEGDNVGGGAQI